MGASEWREQAPYGDGDIEAALEMCRWRVFQAGAYLDEWDEEERDGAAPGSPDELLQGQPEDGTHSIIDMCEGVSTQPSAFTVSPLTPTQLQEAFGTNRPTLAAVTAWLDHTDISAVRRRWEGLYVVAWDGAHPSDIIFAAFSGD